MNAFLLALSSLILIQTAHADLTETAAIQQLEVIDHTEVSIMSEADPMEDESFTAALGVGARALPVRIEGTNRIRSVSAYCGVERGYLLVTTRIKNLQRSGRLVNQIRVPFSSGSACSDWVHESQSLLRESGGAGIVIEYQITRLRGRSGTGELLSTRIASGEAHL